MTLRQFFCVHRNLLRERDEAGVYWLRCETCGYRAEAIRRTELERDEMRETYRLPLPAKAQLDTRKRRKPAKVAEFGQARRHV